jgi:serine/threonine protein kinase
MPMLNSARHASRILSFLNEVKTGSVVNGRYLIGEQLGSGGMGSVYAARHVQLGTKLAIKVLLPELLSDEAAIERFDREARAAAKITDENVVRILDVGQLESGAPYMVMEFLEGQDAAIHLKEHGRLPIEQAIDALLQACAAVTAAHAMHIIHRDIKPSNLFFVPRTAGPPLVKVLDFGVSKILTGGNTETGQVTKTGSILGSPGYVPPEQWFSSRMSDKRSDIWALGLVLYEFLTGRLPFDEVSIPILATKIAYEPAMPPSQLRPEIPLDLEQVVLRCLEKSPDDRFQDVASLAEALKACQRRQEGHGGSPVNHHLLRLNPAVLAQWRRSNPLSMQVAAAILALLAMVGLGSVFRTRKESAAAPRANSTVQAAQQTPPILPPAGPELPGGAPPPSSLAIARPPPLAAEAHSPRSTRDGQRHLENGAFRDSARCRPPYRFNAKGIRVFKVECL